LNARHKEQGERIHRLGISFNSVAKDLKMPRASNNFYFSRGTLAPKHAGYPDRIDRYIKMKEAELARGKTIAGPNLRGYFIKLGVTYDYIATETGVNRADVNRGILNGIWPDEATRDCVTSWIKEALEQSEGRKMITKISLPEEVVEYFGLERDPFTNEMGDLDDIYETKQLNGAEKKAMVAVDKNGWIAITGPVGSGKTTLVKKIKARLAKRKEVHLVEPQTVEKEYLRVSHVLDSILEDLGPKAVRGRRTLEYKARLVGQTLRDAHQEGRKVVILIDEAHLLNPMMLLGLKRIYEFELEFKKLLAIILVGQPPLARTLRRDLSLSEVGQRVDLFEINNINGAMGPYLEHKLARAGLKGGKEVFDRTALKAMHGRVDTPLALNNLAAQAMINAHDVGEKTVSGKIVESV
jgi:MSHA biogenesis protein MshM